MEQYWAFDEERKGRRKCEIEKEERGEREREVRVGRELVSDRIEQKLKVVTIPVIPLHINENALTFTRTNTSYTYTYGHVHCCTFTCNIAETRRPSRE